MRRTPLKKKRDRPRRNEGRVQHGRMKPKAGAPPTEEEARHIARVRSLPCLVPDCRSPATAHHVSSTIHGGRIARSHRRVCPLCRAHHQHDYGRESVERLSHRGFYERFGIDLLAEADRLWQESAVIPIIGIR